MTDCLFCQIDRDIIAENEQCYAVYDSYPVSAGHLLIITKRHIENIFEVTNYEMACINDMLHLCKNIIDMKYSPDGYNVGTNAGKYGGQSIFHLHIHVIPRYRGDVENPRGGVRNILPHKGHY
jgi:diadenosine tetraphosphate (Ap4A) HIT family hydrolase